MKTLWGNMLIKNEENFVWFAVTSVIDYLDNILIWDTGSSDKTLEIISCLRNKFPKIKFRQYGAVDGLGFTKARQEMLEETKSDWLFLIDGDEVWWKDSIKKIRDAIEARGDELNLIFNPTINLIGDIYHYQEEAAGKYHILNKKGHYNIRAINRKIPGLHVERPYSEEGYFNGKGVLIQNSELERIMFVDAPYLHFSHLSRSSRDNEVMMRKEKIKSELGRAFPKNLKYPEVLAYDRPDIVPNPWKKMSSTRLFSGLVQTPFKKIKRRI